MKDRSFVKEHQRVAVSDLEVEVISRAASTNDPDGQAGFSGQVFQRHPTRHEERAA